jgi:hypothetical protein
MLASTVLVKLRAAGVPIKRREYWLIAREIASIGNELALG